jgi:hypothetical protein
MVKNAHLLLNPKIHYRDHEPYKVLDLQTYNVFKIRFNIIQEPG